MDAEPHSPGEPDELKLHFLRKPAAMAASDHQRLQFGRQGHRLGTEVCEGLGDQDPPAAEVVRLGFVVLSVAVRMHRSKLAIAASSQRFVDIVPVPASDPTRIGGLLHFESPILPVGGKGLHHVIDTHVIDDPVPLGPRRESNDPIVLLCRPANLGLAASQGAIPEERVRREASVVHDYVGVELHGARKPQHPIYTGGRRFRVQCGFWRL